MTDETDAGRLELVWPDAEGLSHQDSEGVWSRQPSGPPELVSIEGINQALIGGGAVACLVLPGQRLTALSALKNIMRGRVKLAYFDLPRLEIDDALAGFRTTGRPYPSWLGVVNDHLKATMPLLRDDGVVALMVGDREEPFARILLHQLFGPDNYIGTIVWQRHYSPRQVPNSREIAASHEFILLAAMNRASLPPVAVKRLPTGLRHADGDPRGPWKGGNKGANKDDYPYGTNIPPYRWRIVSGSLPPGMWRLNEFTGVVWGKKLGAVGEFRFVVECTDASQQTVEREFRITVSEQGSPPNPEAPVPWLWSPPSAEAALAITTKELPAGVVGQPYSAMIEASGGTPFLGEKFQGPGRYQEHPKHTLEKAVREDKVMFGLKGNAIPWIKKHANPDEIGQENVYSIWLGKEPYPEEARPRPPGLFGDFGAGYNQDAKKHLLKLFKKSDIPPAYKPETLMNRLLHLFTDTGDWVVDGFGSAADMAATALKVGRRSVFLAGSSDKDRQYLETCGKPRLLKVAEMEDKHSADADESDGSSSDSYDACVVTSYRGEVVVGTLTAPIATLEEGDQYPTLSAGAPFDPRALMVSQGYLPITDTTGSTIDGLRACEILSPQAYLDETTLSEIVERHSSRDPAPVLSVYYFRSLELPETGSDSVNLVRIPFDLAF
jgi:hypothetical protein